MCHLLRIRNMGEIGRHQRRIEYGTMGTSRMTMSNSVRIMEFDAETRIALLKSVGSQPLTQRKLLPGFL